MRGVFQRPPNSGVWWINYYVNGVQHREKVGRKSDATALYQKRKADARAGQKLPQLKQTRKVTVGDLIDDAIAYVKEQDHKDLRNYLGRGEIIRKALGSIPADDLKPQVLKTWLGEHCKSAATFNRYKAVVSLAYREGGISEKVTTNPARLVRQRKEDQGRKRFLSREEYERLIDVVLLRFPEHLPEFIFSVHTGMRLSEQFSFDWSQVHLDRKAVELSKTKNGTARTVRLNKAAIQAIEEMRRRGQKRTDRVFPRQKRNDHVATVTREAFDTRSWFKQCLAEAEIKDYVWHSNRHTFCSWLAMAGATDREIMEAAGHKTLAMAARYSHLSPRHQQSVVDRLTDGTSDKLGNQQAPEQAPGKRMTAAKAAKTR